MRAHLASSALLLALCAATVALAVPVDLSKRGCRIAGPQISANGTVTPGSITCGDEIADEVIAPVDNRTGPAPLPQSRSAPLQWHKRGCRVVGPQIMANGTVIPGSTTCGDDIADEVVAPVDNQTAPTATESVPATESIPATTSTSSAADPAQTGCIIRGPVCNEDGSCTPGSIECGAGIANQVIAAVDNRKAPTA